MFFQFFLYIWSNFALFDFRKILYALFLGTNVVVLNLGLGRTLESF